MSYAEVNQKIQEYVSENGGAKANPMIVYALDSQFLPDTIYKSLCNDMWKPLPKEYPWLIGLFWIRRFYEFGSGNDHLQCIGNTANINEVIRRIQNVWKLNNPISRDSLISHCPILKAAEAGGNSQVTNGMEFLLKSLRPDFSLGEFYAAIEKLEGRANTSEGHIKAAERYEEHFIAVLRTLQTGNGAGWLAEFNEHPLRMAVVKCEWGLLVNGGIRTIALRVVGRDTVTVNQGQVSYEKNAYRSYATFTWDELRKVGIDPEKQLVAGGSNVEPFDFKGVTIIRVSGKELFHRFISGGQNKLVNTEINEIQAVELWVLTKSQESHVFKLGVIPVATSPIRLTESLELYLHKLDLHELDRSIPIQLSFKNQPLLKIGAAPWLIPSNGEAAFQFHLDPETWLVFGEETELELGDFFGDARELEWRNIQNRDGQIFLSKEAYGKATTASVLLPGRGYRLRVSVVFLPEVMRDYMISEQHYNEDGIMWEPQSDPESLQPRVKGSGLCPGLLTVSGGIPITVSVPSDKIHFWIREGLSTELCFDAPLAGVEEILKKSLTLECYLPPGENTVSWGDCDWFVTEEEGYYSFDLSEHPAPAHSVTGAGLRVRMQSGQEIEILRITESPTVELKNEILSITISGDLRVEEWDFCLVAEGASGGQMGELLRSGCCDELACISQENGHRRSLDVGELHPDEGVFLLLCSKIEHELAKDPQAFFSRHLVEKPKDGFFGPISVQNSNLFRSRSAFLKEKGEPSFPVLVPRWISDDWRKQYKEPLTDLYDVNILNEIDYMDSIKNPCMKKVWLNPGALIFVYGGQFTQSRRLKALSLNRCFLEELIQPRKVQFSYGKSPRVQYLERGDYLPITWRLDDKVDPVKRLPSWWKLVDIHECTPNDQWASGALSIEHLFLSQIGSKEALSLVGNDESGNLSHLFLHLVEWMKIAGYSKERRMIFQTAVLCRIHAWLGNDFGDERGKEILSVFVAQAWQAPKTKQILRIDLLTVNWMLAWLHAPGFNANDVL